MDGRQGKARAIAMELGIMAAIGMVAALIGPFGTFAAPLPLRVAQWELFALGGYLFFRPVLAGGEALAATSPLPRLAAIALACALASFPTTVLVAWALSGMRLERVSAADLVSLFPQVLLVGGIATAVQLAMARRPRSTAAPLEPPPVAPATVQAPVEHAAGAPLLARVPPHLGGVLLAVENEDHYVRIHTALGSALVLMRMRDAVAELAGVEGHRVHRGWWVARVAVVEVVRRDRAIALRLVNGLEVPVARNEVPAIRAAGWL